MAFHTHQPAMARRLPSASLHHACHPTHIHPSQMLSHIAWRDDALAQTHPPPPSTDTQSAASSSAYSWHSASPSPQLRDAGWSANGLPSTYSELSFGNPANDYAEPGSRFDSDYLKSALFSNPVTQSHSSSRPSSSSSSSHASNLDPPRFEAASWDNDLYRFVPDSAPDHTLPSGAPPAPAPVAAIGLPASEPASPEQSPRIKQEETVTDVFVFEGPQATGQFPAFASMIEVPLRATGACKEARKMMWAFRLDPFASHNGTAARSDNPELDWSGERVGPLQYSPKMFEFQLELHDSVKAEPLSGLSSIDTESLLPSPSPSIASLGYPNEQEDEDREQAQSWDSSPPSILYSPPITSEPSPPSSYETVMTPAQSLEWQMRYQNTTGNSVGSHYSSPPPPSLRSAALKEHRTSYTTKDTYNRHPYPSMSPLRLPPPTPSSRYISMPAVQDSEQYPENPNGPWLSKSISLAMFYSPSKDTAESSLLSAPTPSASSLVMNMGGYGLSTPSKRAAAISHYSHAPAHSHLHSHQQLHHSERAPAPLRYS